MNTIENCPECGEPEPSERTGEGECSHERLKYLEQGLIATNHKPGLYCQDCGAWVGHNKPKPPTEPEARERTGEDGEPCAECDHEYGDFVECRNCHPPDWSHFTHEGEPAEEPEKEGKIKGDSL